MDTSSVSPELLHGFARGLAPVAFLRNITLLSINMKVIWRASLLKNCEQADQCNNSGKTEEVFISVFLQINWEGMCSHFPRLAINKLFNFNFPSSKQ